MTERAFKFGFYTAMTALLATILLQIVLMAVFLAKGAPVGLLSLAVPAIACEAWEFVSIIRACFTHDEATE